MCVCWCPAPPPPQDLSPLVSMCWHSSGLRFVSGHKDGTVTQWRVDTEEEEEEQSHLIVRKKYFGMWCVCVCVCVCVCSDD